MERRYLKNTLGVLALSSIALFGCNNQNTSNDKPTQKVITKLVIDKDKLEDTFLKVVDSIKSGELDNFKIDRYRIYRGYKIEIPKTEYFPKIGYEYKIDFIITRNYNYSYARYSIIATDFMDVKCIYSESEEVEDAFKYLGEILGEEVKYEEKSLEEVLFGKEQELNEEK